MSYTVAVSAYIPASGCLRHARDRCDSPADTLQHDNRNSSNTCSQEFIANYVRGADAFASIMR